MATKEDFESLLNDPETEARVLRFPKGHCWSSATGFLKSQDGTGVFVKDRDANEAIVNETISLLGKEFCKAFASVDQVAPTSYAIKRPGLDELNEDGPGHLLWKLKEEMWEKNDASVEALRARKKSEGKKSAEELDDEASVEDEKKPPPSEFDCWEMEEAVTYCMSSADELDASDVAVDQSLRRKLRRVAQRSSTKCLDFSKALKVTKFTQDMIRSDPGWKNHKCDLLENPDDALNEAETLLLLREKLSGVEFEASMMFVAAVTLPDVNCENLALQEIDEGSSFRVQFLHFDTGVLPVSAGVSLESLKPIFDEDECDFDFIGEDSCTGYYFPCLFSIPAVKKPLSAEALAGLQKIDTDALKNIIEERFSDEEVFEKGLGGLGEIVKQRVDFMKEYATANPSSSLRMILFHTVAAWKRDWSEYYEESEYAEWIYDTLRWAKGKKE